MDDTYDVGFGKPPKHSQFPKGISGNRKGRPKGKRNLATVLRETLEEKVPITENGSRKMVTKLEAAVKQLANKAASGDLVALKQLIALVRSAEERTDGPPSNQLREDDVKIMQRVLQRHGSDKRGEADGDH